MPISNEFMNREAELRDLLASEKVINVLLVGYTEVTASERRFRSMPWWVYVQFESRYLRCEAVNQWHLVIEIVQGVRRDFEVDSPDEFSTASIGSVLVPGL